MMSPTLCIVCCVLCGIIITITVLVQHRAASSSIAQYVRDD
jgi:hypothetical protein